MRHSIRFFAAVPMLLVFGGCSGRATKRLETQAPAASADARAIVAAREAQNAAMAAGDADKAAAYWTEDVTIRRALGQDVRGRAAYRQLVRPTGARDSSLVYQRDPGAVQVSAHFPLAFETGTWLGHLGGATGPAVIGGPYSAQWVKRDGRWLIRSEVFVAITCAGAGCGYQAVP